MFASLTNLSEIYTDGQIEKNPINSGDGWVPNRRRANFWTKIWRLNCRFKRHGAMS